MDHYYVGYTNNITNEKENIPTKEFLGTWFIQKYSPKTKLYKERNSSSKRNQGYL